MARASSGVTLQQLQYFIEVAAEGSISVAADALYVAQPTMSAAMKDLETRVGRALLSRSSRGVTLTADGAEFLGYARQIVEQVGLLEQRYLGRPPSRRLLGVSTQHYSFAVDAFVRMVRSSGVPAYEFSLRETRTWEIIEDVRTLRSEVGILYRNDFTGRCSTSSSASRGSRSTRCSSPRRTSSSRGGTPSPRGGATLADLADLLRLTFDQAANNSFSFAEEILSTLSSAREIRVSDRATIFNLMIGLDGYTISTGIVSDQLDPEIIAIPLGVDERIEIGWIDHAAIPLTEQAQRYLDELCAVVAGFGVALLG